MEFIKYKGKMIACFQEMTLKNSVNPSNNLKIKLIIK